jgi:glyoxylase-like metal-dependent hydrolase (beta-lactamase superfamily II)
VILDDRMTSRQCDHRWQVTAFHYGELVSTRAALYHDWNAYGEPDGPASLAYYFWLLEREGEVVLVDTGFDPEVAVRRGRAPLADPVGLLASHGLEPERVGTIVLSHLHYDHVGNVARFPEATLHVPGEELEFWHSPAAKREQFAAHVEQAELQAIERAESEGRVARYEAGQLFPGVDALHLPGHTPGLHGLLVQGRERPVLLTSDAVHLYEELERRRPFALFTDLAAMRRSYDDVDRIRATTGALLVPGHDPGVGRGVTPVGTTAEQG